MTSRPLCVGDPVTQHRRERARLTTHQQSRCQQGAETGKPLPGRSFNKERVMMQQVIILIVLLLISFAAYSQPIREGRDPLSPLYLYFRSKKSNVNREIRVETKYPTRLQSQRPQHL
ncbi:type I toxin-antitoxin system Ibs family toxin [Salmonella enterica]|nr:type I toxin-antitoxin system Ibs family toxin [Salmonella enterica]EDW4357565.1 type I toxin-antitoxin system Ibs family toxin [Salmonella enterica subsp. salamae]EAX8552631.1 type I toxin-antitoxin system Ibs family toxin [Salmonella enterica]EAX8592888.1 type I toxin-antitoxin system Ibs family toxin [Salmonella enterica]EAX8614698.1 type I toxin-antitoxin system Ibs family toxin [Salmonella enterica]